jgi:hypothetical protein
VADRQEVAMSGARYLLPVRAHLRPKPQRDLIANVPPEVQAKLPAAFTDVLRMVPCYEQVDRDHHPLGWGYDLVRFVPLAQAWSMPIEGRA